MNAAGQALGLAAIVSGVYMPTEQLLPALEAFRRRLKLLGVAVGAGWVAAAAVGLLVAVAALDYLLNLNGIARMTALAIAAGMAGLLATRRVVRPARAPLPLSEVAGRLETAFPQFDDRLRSTVGILTGRGGTGAPALQARVVAQTAGIAGHVRFADAIVLRPFYESAGTAGGAALLLLLAALLMPNFARVAALRLLSPLANHPWPKLTHITLAQPLPPRVPAGQTIAVKIRLNRPRTPVLHVQSLIGGVATGPVQDSLMSRNDDGTYEADADARLTAAATAGQLRLSIDAGDDTLTLPPIDVVQRLTLGLVTATLTPPAYAHRPAVTVSLADGPATVVAGSSVNLTARFNKPLADPDPLQLSEIAPPANAKPPAITWRASGDAAAGTWTADRSLRFHLIGRDADALSSVGLEEFEIVVRSDTLPTVRIELPRRTEDRTPIATLPLQAAAEDDFGIKSATLFVERLGDHRKWALPLVRDAKAADGIAWSSVDAGNDRVRMRLGDDWNLAALETAGTAPLKPGDVLEYCVGVTDNFNLNGQTHPAVLSGKLQVNIVSQEQMSAHVADQMRALGGMIREAKGTQDRIAGEAAAVQDDAKQKPALDTADRATISRLAAEQSADASQAKRAADQMADLARTLDENHSTNADLKQTAADVAASLAATAQGPMRQASDVLAGQRDANASPADRQKQFDDIKSNQYRAADALAAAADRVGTSGSLASAIDSVNALLAAQQAMSQKLADVGSRNLGKAIDQLSPQDQASLAEQAKAQQDLADKTDQAMGQLQKAADSMAQSSPIDADAMKQAASTGQSQSVSGNQRQSAQASSRNQQSAAQSAGKKAELGLQMMLSDLREGERRKLEQLTKRLAELNAQIALLIKRQASHNLADQQLQSSVDNLPPGIRAALLADADLGATAPLPAPPGADQLTRSQEQTERNTRDLGNAAASQQDGAQAGGLLTKAAGKMERAAVELRDGHLDVAYDPSQVEALDLLHQAAAVVAEQQRKADQQAMNHQKAAIRARYEQVRADQMKLDADTAAIDAARAGDGTLRRPDQLRLNGLPGVQGKLADVINAIEPDLQDAGGIVFVWANKDIAQSMSGVKDRLGHRETSSAVQAEQNRIVAQLDAMIHSLSIKSPDEKFEQSKQAGGGGGSGEGGGAVKLPGEAELQLLKALQAAVNNETKALQDAAAKQPDAKPDAAAATALGQRQALLRTVLIDLMEKSSGGRVKIGAEPDNRDLLPEEAKPSDVEDDELERDLLHADPTADDVQKGSNRIGDRMARSRQRLALNDDPGPVTQAVQQRILKDLDELIDQARKQQQNASSSASKQSGGGQQMANAGQNPNGAQPNQGPKNNGSNAPAGESAVPRGGGSGNADTTTPLKQSMQEWANQLPPRQRQAVLEGETEHAPPKFEKLVEDYYRALAARKAE